MFEPSSVSADKNGKLSLFALLGSVAKKPYEHYQEHQIADDADLGLERRWAVSALTDPGLIGGLATRMQKNQVRRATGAPDFVLELPGMR
jgi:hypothetical protein